MAKSLKEILAKQIQLASQVRKAADEAALFKHECNQIKFMIEELAELINRIAQESVEYDRPILRIMDEVEQVLDKALSLVLKCGENRLMDRFFMIISAASFSKVMTALQTCIEDVKWSLRVHIFNDQAACLRLPPILTSDPSLRWIWASIAALYDSSQDNQLDTARELLSLCRNDDRRKKLIIEEGGLVPLLKWLKDGKMEEQEIAATLIGSLGCDSESVEHMIDAGVFQVFEKILREGPVKVQAEVASSISELTTIHPKCQDICVQNNIIHLLISHVSFETIQEHVQNFIPINKATSVLAVVKASSNSNKGKASDYDDDKKKNSTNHKLTLPLSSESFKDRQLEDPDTKSYRKATAARALWQLVKGNTTICRIITESKALICFTTLLKQGPEDVQYPSIMALMEITAIAEQDTDLRREVFKPSSPARKAVIDGLYKTIQRDTSSSFLIPSIKAIGKLARTFRVTNVKIISLLIELIDVSKSEVVMEVLNALKKFCSRENQLHLDNCKAIMSIGGVNRLCCISC